MKRLFLIGILAAPMTGCIKTENHIIVEQPKPLEININFTGHLDLVIQDARDNVEKINGEKPPNVVRPEDIGLPPKPGVGGTGGTAPLPPAERPALAMADTAFFPAVYVHRSTAGGSRLFLVGVQDDLTKSLAARNPQIRALWDSKAVGEAHSGLLVAKGTLTAEQQKLVDAENADRTALYAAEAKATSAAKGTAVSPGDVAIAYYIARLGYAKAGNWYEKSNAAGQWEWKHWGQ